METDEVSPNSPASLQGVTANLFGYESNCQFINPMTLSSNGMVDESWICESGAQIGLTRSSFSYTNGVQVEAYDDIVSFRHRGTPLAPSEALSTWLARRYVEVFDASNWIGCSIEFFATISLSDMPSFAPWPHFSAALSIEDVRPRIGVNAIYQFPDKRVRVDMDQSARPDADSLNCYGWVYRPLTDSADDNQVALESCLENWQSDWQDVLGVISGLIEATPAQGGTQ